MLWKVDGAQFELTQVTSEDAAIAYLKNKQSKGILFASSIAKKRQKLCSELQ